MPTLLVIDDDPAFLQSAEREFTEAGYDVLLALTDTQAALLLERLGEQIDLVLVDLVMPSSPGIEVIRRLKASWPNLPLIASTHAAFNTDLEVACYFGARATLLKPISPDWFSTVRHVLSDAAAG